MDPQAKEQGSWSPQKKRTVLIGTAALILIVVAAITAGVVVSKNNSASSTSSSSSNAGGASTPSASLTTASAAAASATVSAPSASPSGSNSTGTTANTSASPWGGKKALIGYWGQDAIGNGYTREFAGQLLTNNLSWYCDTGMYQQMNLAFMPTFGSYPRFSLSFGGNETSGVCNWVQDSSGTPPAADVQKPCNDMGWEIKHCQSKNVKVVLSMAGDHISQYYFLTGEGKQYAQLIYDKFLQGKGDPLRPFGDAVLDGVELDIEKNYLDDTSGSPGKANDWQPEMIDFFVTLRKLSPNVILGAVPQCYLNHWDYTDYNMGHLIASKDVKIDYLIIQYYNNPACSYPFGFNFADWKTLYSGPIVVGLPGDPTSAVYGGFLSPNDLQAFYLRVVSLLYELTVP